MKANETEQKKILSILHFNDVYDLQPNAKQPKAGAAYFEPLLAEFRANDPQNTLTLFSGDAFAPALLSNQYQGQNMLKPLNSFKIDLACIGNHDLDYSQQRVKLLMSKTNFPWLCSNVFYKGTNNRFLGGEQYKIFEKAGLKIGIFSLAQNQWIDTLMPQYVDIVQCYPFQQYAQFMIKQLKAHKVDLIIALTHMMRFNDKKLAEKYPEIDLILGGHDHLILHEKVNNSVLIKSGTNFKNMSYIRIQPRDKQNKSQSQQKTPQLSVQSYKKGTTIPITLKSASYLYHIYLIQVNHAQLQIKPNLQLNQYINSIYEEFAEHQSKVACYVKTDIDLLFNTIRKQQSAFLQFVVSIYRFWAKADCAFMNSGNFRMDTYVKAGPMTYGTLSNVIEDDIIVLKVEGEKIIGALENCVSQYPNLSGRYSALSGISLTWDCSKPPLQRVLRDTVRINGQEIVLDKLYKVAMHSFASSGGDGFHIFKTCEQDQHHAQKKNSVLLYELVNSTQTLLKGYSQKYPNRIFYRNEDGRKILQLDLPKPKNVKMIGEIKH